MACCAAQHRLVWAPVARRPAAVRHPRHQAAVPAQAASRRQSSGGSTSGSGGSSDAAAAPSEAAVATAAAELQTHLQQVTCSDSNAEQSVLDNVSAALPTAETDPAAIAAARQRLQAYLQQQSGIRQAKAAELASKLSAVLGAAADQLVPVPLQWFVGRGMQPVKAAQLVVHMCKSGRNATHAYLIRQWPTWQPVFEANWQLADNYLAAYQQQCKATKQRPLKSSQSLAVLLSGQPSRYYLLLLPDLSSKVALVQQQLRLTDAEVGQLMAAGLVLTGTEATLAAAMQWLVSYAGSQEAAASMLRFAPTLLSYSAGTLDSKVAVLQAAWAGKLQPGQVQRLVNKSPLVLEHSKRVFGPAADVLCSWFPQPGELLAVVAKAPALLFTPAACLQANERWMTGPPLSLSRRQFLALVQAAPQPFSMKLAAPLTQHKLAFLTQVVGVRLERALSASQLNYLKSGLTTLAGRYFLLAEHGVPLPRHKDGGVSLSYATEGLPNLLRRMRPHDSQQRLPADDEAAVEY